MKSWKTTVVGAALAGLVVLDDILKNGEVQPLHAVIAVAIAVLGYLMKDYDKDGQ